MFAKPKKEERGDLAVINRDIQDRPPREGVI